LGRPFATELDALPDTYQWAMAQPIDTLASAIERLCPNPLLAVGSGGSFSLSQFASHLHCEFAAQAGAAITPLQAAALDRSLTCTSILIPTARGNNSDIIGAARALIAREPRRILILTANRRARISRLANQSSFIDLLAYDIPFGRDGFLATNSLLGFSVLLTRAYSAALGCPVSLPKSFSSFFADRREVKRPGWIDDQCRDLWTRRTLIVLYGASTSAAAIDIESKFTEAALGNVQIADFRQFAHGRHHWLAKQADVSAVVALVSPADAELAKQTLGFLPSDVPVHLINVQGNGAMADLAAIVRGFYLAGSAGRARQIDPGRPGVPSFGRELYHANAFRRANGSALSTGDRAIERKSRRSVHHLGESKRLSFWRDQLSKFAGRLSGAVFPALALDYDGTMCDEDQRFDPLPKDVVAALSKLLRGGIILGVATGRGKSVRVALRTAFAKKLWGRIVVGYYNGAEVISLADDAGPDGSDLVDPALNHLRDTLTNDCYLTEIASLTTRSRQITLLPAKGVDLDAVWLTSMHLANRAGPGEFSIMKSGHSVDIVPVHVSKLAVVDHIKMAFGLKTTSPVLCIGDRGQWPGNDSALLGGPYSLSVFEVSPDPDACWNLAPAGERGRAALLSYLQAMHVTRRGFRLRLPDFE